MPKHWIRNEVDIASSGLNPNAENAGINITPPPAPVAFAKIAPHTPNSIKTLWLFNSCKILGVCQAHNSHKLTKLVVTIKLVSGILVIKRFIDI